MYVCSELRLVDGVQTCVAWAVHQGFLPQLTFAEANLILASIAPAFVVVFTVKIICKMFGV